MTALPASPDESVFRRAMGRFATGVTVISTVREGIDHAMTASAVASVSMEPLLVLICVERDARFHEAVADAGVWGVSILEASARPAAQWLASRGRPLHGQLDQVPCHRGPATGVALVDASLATLECHTVAIHPAGDHSIVVGEVLTVEVPEIAGPALTYFRGQYGRIG